MAPQSRYGLTTNRIYSFYNSIVQGAFLQKTANHDITTSLRRITTTLQKLQEEQKNIYDSQHSNTDHIEPNICRQILPVSQQT